MTQCTWMIPKHPDDLMIVWAVCYLRVWNFKSMKCILYYQTSTISPWRQDATLEWTSTKRRQWKLYYDDIMTRKSGCHPNNSHTPTRTTTSITYSLVRVAIHQNDASLCWNWQQASGKSHVLSKRFAGKKPRWNSFEANGEAQGWRDPETTTWSESMHNKWFNHIQSFFGFWRIEVQQKTDQNPSRVETFKSLVSKICFRKSWSKKLKFINPYSQRIKGWRCFSGFPSSNLDSRSWWIFTKHFAGQPQTRYWERKISWSGKMISTRWYGENLQYSNDTMIDTSSLDKSWQIMWRR